MNIPFAYAQAQAIRCLPTDGCCTSLLYASDVHGTAMKPGTSVLPDCHSQQGMVRSARTTSCSSSTKSDRLNSAQLKQNNKP